VRFVRSQAAFDCFREGKLMAKLIEVIVADELIGRGNPDDPFTRINRYYDPKTGEKLAESEDPRGPRTALACQLDKLVRDFEHGSSSEREAVPGLMAAVATLRRLS
jgi:hypothetical protein